MELQGSTLRLTTGDCRKAMLTSLDLPPGARPSGGLLFPAEQGFSFVLCADEEMEVGAEVEIPPGLACKVASVRKATLNGRPVTLLELRAPEGGSPDAMALLRRRWDRAPERAPDEAER